MLVPRYKLFLFHTPIKPDLLGFPRICVFACGLRDHVIPRFASCWDEIRERKLIGPELVQMISNKVKLT